MYVTAAEFLAVTNIPEGKFSPAAINNALRFAERLFDKLTNRHDYGMWCIPRQLTALIDGRGHDTIRLPWPIVKVQHVKLNGQTITSDCAIYTWFIARKSGKFPEGHQNVEVLADFGDKSATIAETVIQNGQPVTVYTAPEDVRHAVIAIAEIRLTKEKVFRDERIVRIGPLNEIRIGSITGHVDVDGIIEAYKVTQRPFLEVR